MIMSDVAAMLRAIMSHGLISQGVEPYILHKRLPRCLKNWLVEEGAHTHDLLAATFPDELCGTEAVDAILPGETLASPRLLFDVGARPACKNVAHMLVLHTYCSLRNCWIG